MWGDWSGEYGGGGGGSSVEHVERWPRVWGVGRLVRGVRLWGGGVFRRACGEVAKSMGCGETGQGSTGGGGVFRRGDCEQSAATALTERRETVTLLTDGGTAHVLS